MKKNLDYLACRDIMKQFLKKKYWNVFSSNNFFYIIDEKKECLFTFVEQFFGDAFGCQLFFTPTGLNYVHDILTVESEYAIGVGDCDSLCAVFVPKDELKQEEKDFLKANNLRTTDLNLMIYRFEPGFAQRIANQKETQIFFDVIEFISSLLHNDFNQVVQGFEEEMSVIALVSKEDLSYSANFAPLPILEQKLKRLKVNTDFVHEFENKPYLNDECFLFASYLPVVVKETKVRPMFLYFYFPNQKKSSIKYIMSKPSEYKNLIFGIIYDVFTEIGVPLSIHFNHRQIYALVEKTITAMHIEHDFMREDTRMDGYLNELISNVYKDTVDELVEEEEVVHILMESITNVFNQIMDFEEDEVEDKPEEFVS